MEGSAPKFPTGLIERDWGWTPFIIAAIVGVIAAIRSYVNGRGCPSRDRIVGKTIIVTGASSGIGYRTVLELALRGAHVIMAVRDVEKGKVEADAIRKQHSRADVRVMELDVSSFDSVKKFVRQFSDEEGALHVLINNAGLMFYPTKTLSPDDFELHFATNYLGHFLLSTLLLPKLKYSSPSRIINVSAVAYRISDSAREFDDVNFDEEPYGHGLAYARSKLALVLFTRIFAKKLTEHGIEGVTVNALHPGIARTEIGRHTPIYQNSLIKLIFWPWMWLLLKSADAAAQTAIYAASDKDLEKVSGKYFAECSEKALEGELAENEELAEKLWRKSLSWTLQEEKNLFNFS